MCASTRYRSGQKAEMVATHGNITASEHQCHALCDWVQRAWGTKSIYFDFGETNNTGVITINTTVTITNTNGGIVYHLEVDGTVIVS